MKNSKNDYQKKAGKGNTKPVKSNTKGKRYGK